MLNRYVVTLVQYDGCVRGRVSTVVAQDADEAIRFCMLKEEGLVHAFTDYDGYECDLFNKISHASGKELQDLFDYMHYSAQIFPILPASTGVVGVLANFSLDGVEV